MDGHTSEQRSKQINKWSTDKPPSVRDVLTNTAVREGPDMQSRNTSHGTELSSGCELFLCFRRRLARLQHVNIPKFRPKDRGDMWVITAGNVASSDLPV